MTTESKPYWWKGTPQEWNALSENDRVLHRTMAAGPARDKEAERLLAFARGQQYKPAQEHVKSQTSGAAPKRAPQQYYGIRNWTEDISPYPASRIRNIILYLLDVKKDPWYLTNCTNVAFVRRNIDRMNAEVPDDFVYDPEAVIQSRRIHVPGENQPVVLTFIDRMPETEEERITLRERFGVCDQTIKYLAKQDCKKCHGKGFIDVSDYPDDPLYAKLASSDACSCVWE